MANEERQWVQGLFNLEKKRLRWVLELPAGNGARAEASGQEAMAPSCSNKNADFT